MNICKTMDGYLKIDYTEGELDFRQLQKMNSLSYFVPSLKDRFEENAILYHRGEYIPFAEYINDNTYNLESFRKLILNVFEVFAKLESDGYSIENTLSSLDYVYIHPADQTIRLVYVPAEQGVETREKVIKGLLKELTERIKTNGAAILLGTLLELSNGVEMTFTAILNRVQNVQSDNMQPKERIVEKRVEVPVEKVIYKGESCGKLTGIVAVTEAVTGIVIPMVVAMMLQELSIAVYCSIGLSVYALLVYIIAGVVFGNKKNTSATNIQENRKNTNVVNFLEPVSMPMQNIRVDSGSTRVERKNNMPMSNHQSMINNQAKSQQLSKKNISNGRESAQVSRGQSLIQNNASQINASKVQEQKIDKKVQSAAPFFQEEFEGTIVLGKDSNLSCAYLIEEGKYGLMDRIFIDKPEFVVGREQEADYTVPDNVVSKRHAKITKVQKEYYIEDLESSNGTNVDGKRIIERTILQDGSIIRLGNKTFVFHE
ncbi:MAG: FHA domain-containing protein [Lachnospiraceae bacterium]|nr:FHA domain-containing protein [Lachnospiraceae bacterium]